MHQQLELLPELRQKSLNAYADSTITEASNVAMTVYSKFWNSELTHAKTIDGYTTGVVTGTVASSTDLSDLDHYWLMRTEIMPLQSRSALEMRDVSAANLNTLDGLTTVAVNASNVTTITSSTLDDINTLYTSSGFSGLGDEAITVSDSGSIAASTITAIAAVNTSGT